MKSFLDTGFLLTLLFDTGGSPIAWDIAHQVAAPLSITTFQVLNLENRISRQIESVESTPQQRALAANALQNFRWLLDQQVFVPISLDYEIAIKLALQWQKEANDILSALLFLWPALAATVGATHFLSFDPRTRKLAKTAGMKLLPEKL